MTKPITRIAGWLNEFVTCDKQHCSNRIRELYDIAEQRERSGFEKWLQFELLIFFKNVESRQIKKIEIESPLNVDRKKEKLRSSYQTDIVLRLRNDISYGIELKVRRKPSGAIKALNADLRKLMSSRSIERATENFAIVLCGQALSGDDLKKIDNIPSEFFCLNDVNNNFSFLIGQA